MARARGARRAAALAALTLAGMGSIVYYLGMRRRRLNYWLRMRKASKAVGAGARELGSSVALHANRLQRRLFA